MEVLWIVVAGVMVVSGAVFLLLRYRARDPRVAAARSAVRTAKAELRQVTQEHDQRCAPTDQAVAAAQQRREDKRNAARAAYDQVSGAGNKLGQYRGVELYERWIKTPHGSGAINGAIATVDSQVSSRITATRLLAIGVLALAAQKKTGNLYLSIDTPQVSSVVECPPQDQQTAREFAVSITNQGRRADASDPRRPERIEAAKATLEAAYDTSEVENLQLAAHSVRNDPQALASIAAASERLDICERELATLTGKDARG